MGTLKWTPRALKELQRIYDFIYQDSPHKQQRLSENGCYGPRTGLHGFLRAAAVFLSTLHASIVRSLSAATV